MQLILQQPPCLFPNPIKPHSILRYPYHNSTTPRRTSTNPLPNPF